MATSPHIKREALKRLPIPQLLIGLGILLCLWPLATDLLARQQARQVVSSLSDSALAQDESRRQELLVQARSFNALLAGSVPELGVADILPYALQLDDGTRTGAMAWIEVPRAGINLPIYHGHEEGVLAQGVGHWQASSLPVGGSRTHAWLEGHSGMQQSSLFDAIRLLEPGDVIGIHVLGEDLAYRVTDWQIVEPTSIEGPDIQEGDELTLVTCTTTPDAFNPKGRTGVNDKRLLVNAERCAYDPAEFEGDAAEAAADLRLIVNEHSFQALVALVALVSLVGITVARKVTQERKVA